MTENDDRGVAQSGSAPASGAGGRWFKSTRPDHPLIRLWSRFGARLTLILIASASFAVKLRNLGHAAVTYWDESFHALVAKNLLKHPLKPTLIDIPYLPYDFKSWGANHVWLHKPILPMWTIALSYAAFGTTALALRLPSALLSVGAVVLTYLIGAELLDKRAGLIAAALQGFAPIFTELTHGYLYSDHIDIALLFWTELGVYFVARTVRTGKLRAAAFAGAAQGLAYLSKSYLAAIVLGVALTAWLLPYVRLGSTEKMRLRGKHLLVLMGSTIAVAAPWTIFCIVQYPNEFWHEHEYVWRHLNTDIEKWGAPWDRLMFDYAIRMAHVFYTPAIVACVGMFWRAYSEKNGKLWLVLAWGFGVVVPHVLSQTKTPSATAFGMPAFYLILGMLMSNAFKGRRWELFLWTGISILCLVLPPSIPTYWGRGFPDPPAFGAVMRTQLWVVWHAAGALLIAGALALGGRLFQKRAAHMSAAAFCAAVTLFLGWQMAQTNWAVVERNRMEPTFSDIADFARESLPENAVLLFEYDDEKKNYGEHQLTNLLLDKTCYKYDNQDYESKAKQIVEADGVPYIVTFRELPLPVEFHSERYDRTIYRWEPAEQVE